MNTQELERCMSSDKFIAKQMGGVMAINEIDLYVARRPLLYILNVDKLPKKGSHWVAVYMDKNNKAELFDSLGQKPDNNFTKLLETNGYNGYKYNNNVIQGTRPVCGEFCLFFCYYRSRHVDFEDIVNLWTNNTNMNDLLVIDFFKTHF